MAETSPAATLTPVVRTRPRLHRAELAVLAAVSALMFAASALQWWSFPLIEVLGFITGGVCVWLNVREHIATWPIGLANNVVFFVLFWQGRLFADAVLQIVYFMLGVYGWWSWLHGGSNRTPLVITKTTRREWALLLVAIPFATWAVWAMLVAMQGAAPFWDALTTVICLAAQLLLGRKRLENWLLWIVADLIYIPLYASRDLQLTSILYFVFLLMCLAGYWQWSAAHRHLVRQTSPTLEL